MYVRKAETNISQIIRDHFDHSVAESNMMNKSSYLSHPQKAQRTNA